MQSGINYKWFKNKIGLKITSMALANIGILVHLYGGEMYQQVINSELV